MRSRHSTVLWDFTLRSIRVFSTKMGSLATNNSMQTAPPLQPVPSEEEVPVLPETAPASDGVLASMNRDCSGDDNMIFRRIGRA